MMRAICSRVIQAMAFVALLVAAPSARANVITQWNLATLEILTDTQWPMTRVVRALTMTQIAVADAVAAIHGGYAPYLAGLPATPNASAAAAASQAAARVLLDLAPEQAAKINATNIAVLATIPASDAKTSGIELGNAAGYAILKARANDGADWSVDYTPGSSPGAYRPTSNAEMVTPRFTNMKPFLLERADALRPPPPPFGSAQYERDLAEVIALGARGSTLRTPDQTRIAIFHAPFGYHPWNAIARHLIDEHRLGLAASARILGLLNLGIAEVHSVGMDAKYAYNFWRPTTAAQGAGNADWEAMIPVPQHPEYICMHCIIGATGQHIMESVFGDGPVPFSVTSVGSGETRKYRNFRQFAEEEALSRLYAGVHYRWSLIVGSAMGDQIAAITLAKAFRPVR
jgi:hypothetical protein